MRSASCVLSRATGNAAQHHMAMREIAEFYKFGGPRPDAPSAGERLGEGDLGSVATARQREEPILPTLERLHVWSDGQRTSARDAVHVRSRPTPRAPHAGSQYKGEKCFGRNAEWPKKVPARACVSSGGPV